VVVIDATGQQGIGFGAFYCVVVALVVELGLHRIKKITIEDGELLAGEDFALEDNQMDGPSGADKRLWKSCRIAVKALTWRAC
jgi:hypothetical protein